MERMMTEDKGGNDVVIDAQRRCEHDENILAEGNELNMDLSENNLIVEDSLHMDEENFDGGSGENKGIDDGNSYENKNKGGNDVIIDANGDFLDLFYTSGDHIKVQKELHLVCFSIFLQVWKTMKNFKICRIPIWVILTRGEDYKVNLWAIGRPNPTASLSGHSSGLDSVSFDSSEVFVAAGAASCTIKLWNLEEPKTVRTLPGHRSNCISLDFHPFGEIFASGSSDTNLKIWDIRLKGGCIHTYKDNTRGVNAIRFTPDGRWVVSGGEDNTGVQVSLRTTEMLSHNLSSIVDGYAADHEINPNTTASVIGAQQLQPSNYVVPEDVKASGYQIGADELGSVVEGRDQKKLIFHGGVPVCALLSLMVGIATEGWPRGAHDGLGIFASIFWVVFVTATSDYRQSLQFRDLDKEKKKISVQVTRNGYRHKMSIYELLPGDIVHLAIGDQVPADGLFFYGFSVLIHESVLTRESEPVMVSDENPFLLSGSKVQDGSCKMLMAANCKR
ncbi:hypothetical protein ACET3Z_005012 [Daucus carota]